MIPQHSRLKHKKCITEGKMEVSKHIHVVMMSHACMLSCFSHVQLCDPMDYSPPGSLDSFSRQEYWNELPCPPPEDLPKPGIKTMSLMSPALAGRFFTTSTPWEAPFM